MARLSFKRHKTGTFIFRDRKKITYIRGNGKLRFVARFAALIRKLTWYRNSEILILPLAEKASAALAP